MAREELIITIDAEGDVSIRVAGVKGRKCLDLTKWLEQELGVVTDRRKTSDYYEQEAVAAKTTVRGKS